MDVCPCEAAIFSKYKKKNRNQSAERCSFYLISTPEPAMPHAVAFVCNSFSTGMLQKMMISSEVFKGYYIYFVDNKKYFNLGNFISVNNLEDRGKTKVVLSKMWEVEPIQVNFCTHFRFSFLYIQDHRLYLLPD